MNIDERLEAVARSLELLSHLHQEAEGRISRLENSVTVLTQTTTRNFEIVLDSLKRAHASCRADW